ncbi:peptidase inhibitor family I36 protein [Leifsonia sp. PS1209]|uniref:peptidase inhibitor family I36 protein n=1 Tax=Leifsonia sp. PS1209 TaxID=2724914 RepID=UPI001442B620|nr:peptidase inhibitor family I36 protein [Leifsonia sp. PS1209]QIZ99019.1 hypothetical protein HF024_11205 [Leifsonia sp. PS1209]
MKFSKRLIAAVASAAVLVPAALIAAPASAAQQGGCPDGTWCVFDGRDFNVDAFIGWPGNSGSTLSIGNGSVQVTKSMGNRTSSWINASNTKWLDLRNTLTWVSHERVDVTAPNEWHRIGVAQDNKADFVLVG